MTHAWILDVLADLETYATERDLPELAAQLELTRRKARRELAANRGTKTATGSGRGTPEPARHAGEARSAM